ncbi:MAG TPA: 4-hydroxy-tetrahydrodipicolinate synthase [Minicystis sp.]|nr:4-hydroxy-tetrahydrodipicolinate synthase [Minicystis sp.]
MQPASSGPEPHAKTRPLAGTWTALVTPLSADGESVDHAALEALVEAQIQGGVSGLVPCGTTGEAPTLTDDEQQAVIARTVKAAKGRVPVFAGTGTFSTKKTIAASKAAVAAGADGVMIVMPYYNKPSQEGMAEHVLAIANAVPSPIILYNIPGRSVVDLAADTTQRICERAPNVVGLKDATGNVLRCQELVRRLGDRLAILSGDDALTLGMMACGARGVISVTSNVRPREVSDVTRAMAAGDVAKARSLHLKLLELHGLMFVEPNPAPAKAALAAAGKMTPAVRLPLVPAREATRSQIATALAKLDKG